MSSSKSRSSVPDQIIEPWRLVEWNNIGFHPHPGQIRAFNSYLEHQFNWFCAGRRGGKSHLGGEAIAWTEFIRKESTIPPPWYCEKHGLRPQRWPKKILLIAPFYKQARIIYGKVYREAHRNRVPLRVDRFSEQSMEMETDWGALIMCQTAKNIKALPGFDWDLIIADELPLYPSDPEETFDEALFPSLLDGHGSFLGIGTPDFPGSYSHDLALKGMDPEIKLWGHETWSTYDNWHMPHFAAILDEWRKTTPTDIFDRQYMGKYVPREGLVYPEAQSCIMNAEEIYAIEKYISQNPSALRMFRAIDFGFTNPFACIYILRLGDKTYAWDEYYQTRCNNRYHAIQLAKHEMNKGYKIEGNVCDTADPSAINYLATFRYNGPRGIVRLQGFWAVNYVKPKVIDRIDLMRRIMAAGQYRIHPRCRELLKEYGKEKYPDRMAMRNADEKPLDADNHGTSAVGYYHDFSFGKTRYEDEQELYQGPPAESHSLLEGYDI